MISIWDSNAADRKPGRRAVLAGARRWLERYMERHARTDEIRALHAKSDADLARMGLERDNIVRHVYRDRFLI